MSANIESMFYVRKTPWHGLGTRVEFALDSKEALVAAGLDWKVIQKSIMTDDGNLIPGFKANIRNTSTSGSGDRSLQGRAEHGRLRFYRSTVRRGRFL